VTGPEAHPPTHVLAELAEGVLEGAQAREVRAHVDQCLTCQAAIDELAQVTVALGALPAELPVPEFVAARISHALAAERSSGGAAAESAAPAASGSEGGTVAWFRRRLPQGLAAAASVAVVGLAGYVVVSGGPGGGGDDASTAGSGADAAVEAAPEETTSVGPMREAPAAPSATAGDGQDDDGPLYTDGEELTTPSRVDPAELTAAVEDVVQEGSAVLDGCGQELSDELALPLIGSDHVGAGVLIVLDDTDTYDGWLLATCHSRSNEQIEPPVEVPKSE
jgi:hypothetical protein